MSNTHSNSKEKKSSKLLCDVNKMDIDEPVDQIEEFSDLEKNPRTANFEKFLSRKRNDNVSDAKKEKFSSKNSLNANNNLNNNNFSLGSKLKFSEKFPFARDIFTSKANNLKTGNIIYLIIKLLDNIEMDDLSKLTAMTAKNVYSRKLNSSNEFVKRALEGIKHEDEMVVLTALTELSSELSMAHDNLADDLNVQTLIKELTLLFDKFSYMPDILSIYFLN